MSNTLLIHGIVGRYSPIIGRYFFFFFWMWYLMHSNTENISKDVEMPFYSTSFSAFEDCYSEFIKHYWGLNSVGPNNSNFIGWSYLSITRARNFVFSFFSPPKRQARTAIKKKITKKHQQQIKTS